MNKSSGKNIFWPEGKNNSIFSRCKCSLLISIYVCVCGINQHVYFTWITIKRAIRFWMGHQSNYSPANRLECPSWAPCILQYIKANLSRLRSKEYLFTIFKTKKNHRILPHPQIKGSLSFFRMSQLRVHFPFFDIIKVTNLTILNKFCFQPLSRFILEFWVGWN